MEIQSVNKQWLVMLPFIFIPKNKIVDFVRYKVFFERADFVFRVNILN